ncbi:hypothetical protein KR084_007038, partial [Drosophila pseudotakahashii]
NGAFGSSCPPDVTVRKLDQDLKNLLLRDHNLVRQKWASGKGKFPRRACKMETVKWDEDLANVALLNAKTCLFAHDACRNIEKYRYSGQNVYMMIFWQCPRRKKQIEIPTSQLLENATRHWAAEEKDIEADHLRSYPQNIKKMIGHLTTLINEKSNAVGCGIVTYMKPNNTREFIVTCNYSYVNFIGETVYSECEKAGSQCPKGLSSQYPPLC